MAVTATALRTKSTTTLSTLRYFATMTLSGTYVSGGFLFNPLLVKGAPGSSPDPSRTVLDFQSRSILGYNYVLVGGATPTTAVVKIFNGITELAAGALPETVIPILVELGKFS